MAYLLDTHTLLWFVSGDNQLPESSRMIIKDIHESCFLSAASLWEITIKLQIKKNLNWEYPLKNFLNLWTEIRLRLSP